jgi:glutaconate CoA-transferase, subunit A
MIQAGSMGVPFLAVRGLLHSDILKYRPDLLVQANPFNPGEPVVVAQAIRPDVAVFHALRADRWGNAITPGPRDDVMMARAARCVIVTAETVVDTPLTPGDAVQDTFLDTFLPAIDVDVVVEARLGAHPCGLGRVYDHDADHCQAYLVAAKQEEHFQAYLERYVFSVSSHAEYLTRVDEAARRGA